MALCPNEIKTHQNCRLSNSFGGEETSSEHLWTFSAIEKSLENHSKLGRFSEIPFMTRQKSPAFETKKVGRYTTFLLMKNMDPSERQ